MKRFSLVAFAAIAAVSISGCAMFATGKTDLEKYASAQRIYNSAMEQLVDGRTECVPTAVHPEYSEAHPLCLISAANYRRIEIVRASADRCLKDADIAIIINDARAGVYLNCAEGAAAALLGYLVTK